MKELISKEENLQQQVSEITDWHEAFITEPFSSTGSNGWYLPASNDRDRTDVRNEFIAKQDLIEPDVEYGRLSQIDYKRLEKFYNECIDRAYEEGDEIFFEQAARKLAELYRHQEALRQLGRTADLNELSRLRAASMSIELFGDIEQSDFNSVLAEIRDSIDKSPDELLEARELSLLLGGKIDISKTERGFSFELTDQTIETLRCDLFEIFPRLEETLAPHEERKVDMKEAVENANKLIAVLGMDKDGWIAKEIDGKAASTSDTKRQVNYGSERPLFDSTTQMNAINVHEAIGHGYRAYMAARQVDSKRRSAMPGTVDFEEGLATGLEQIISGEKRIAGKRYLFALGVHLGLDRGGEKRNFRESYELLYRSIIVENAVKGIETSKLEAKYKAYQESLRTRRGGSVDARDISYFLGAKKAYSWLNEIALLPSDERQEKLRWVLSGRFDPTNEAQAELFRTAVQ